MVRGAGRREQDREETEIRGLRSDVGGLRAEVREN